MGSTDFDAIVIGAGSAGSVIARRLVDAGQKVAVIEAGGHDTNPVIGNVAEAGALWRGPEDWDYTTTEQVGCGGRELRLPRGKVMGGSHALNATIWVRGAEQDFNTWAYMGCPGWGGGDDVLPVFKAIENFDGGDSATRGTSGPLDVVGEFPMNPVQKSILKGAQEIGLELNEDYNSGDVEGVSKMQLNVRDGKRFNTWHAYLKPVADRENLTILTETHVRRLLVEEGRAVGVIVEQEGIEKTFRAAETILTAGAIGTPELLLRSGIGPAAELLDIGVETVHDLPGVGKNLHDHLLSPVIFGTQKPVPTPEVAAAETHLFWKSSPDLAVPDTQPINFSLPMYFLDSMSGPDNGFSLVAGIVRPFSRGEIRLSGPNPEDPLLIDLGALSDQSDVDALVASVRQCREIGRTKSLAEWGPTEIYPGTDVSDDDADLEQYVRDTAVTYHHQVGTSRMGLDAMAVVDPRSFEVHGLSGVRIADASIIPLIPTGNTNAPTIMIAERAAAVIIDQLRERV